MFPLQFKARVKRALKEIEFDKQIEDVAAKEKAELIKKQANCSHEWYIQGYHYVGHCSCTKCHKDVQIYEAINDYLTKMNKVLNEKKKRGGGM